MVKHEQQHLIIAENNAKDMQHLCKTVKNGLLIESLV